MGAIDEFLAQETEEASAEEEAEGDYKIERIKHFALKPLLVEEAILQMNMIGHQFFYVSKYGDWRRKCGLCKKGRHLRTSGACGGIRLAGPGKN